MAVSPQIRVDDEVYERLKVQAEPFVDTPNSVLRRLLGLEGKSERIDAASAPTSEHPRKAPKRSRRRVDALTQEEYWVPILRSVADRGGSASTTDVYADIERQLGHVFTATDRERLKTGDIRWKNRVLFARLDLVSRGYLVSIRRGTWSLTDAGRKFLDAQ